MRIYGFTPTTLAGLVSRVTVIPQTLDSSGNLAPNTSFNSVDCTFDQFAPNLGCYAFPVPC
jgi:hypothetical protein